MVNPPPSKDDPIIIVLDGHGSRFNIELLKKLLSLWVYIYIMLPNSTQFTCPWDQQPFKEYNNERNKNHFHFFEYCENKNISFNIVHESMVCIRSIKTAASKKNCLAGLAMSGYIPWNPGKAGTKEGMQYADGEEEKSAQEDVYDETTKQKIRAYLKLGGSITCKEFFNAIK